MIGLRGLRIAELLGVRLPHVEAVFPQLLLGGGYSKTSEKDVLYNCIGFAMGEYRWWWPDAMRTKYWPVGAPRAETIEAFTIAFGLRGYNVTDAADFEPGFQKVALFALLGKPTHAAIQQPSGRWKSKLGESEDIEHDLRGVENHIYGSPVLVFCRMLEPRIAP